MYALGHDIGTSGVKSVLLSEQGRVIASAIAPLGLIRRGPLCVEQRPGDWLDAVAANTHAIKTSAGVQVEAIRSVTFAAQMQGTLPVDADGEPLSDALIWLDMRAQAESREAVKGWPRVAGYGLFRLWRWLRLTNGVPGLSGRDPVAKMLWLKAHAPDLWQRAHKVVDVLDFVLGFSTGRFVTSHDVGNTTWLMDTRPDRMCWSDELCDRLEIDRRKLPELQPSHAQAGALTARAAARFGLNEGTSVFVGSGDLAAMAVGTGAISLGVTTVALGTSAWVSRHVAERRHDLRTYTASICSAVDGGHLVVAHQEAGGACLTWLRNQAAAAHDYEALLALGMTAPPGAGGLVFLPWMNGEYAPVDDPNVRGGFLNLSFDHGLPHLCRALVEGVAYNVRWALSAVDGLCGGREDALLRVAGGAARAPLFCQTLSDVTARPVLQIDRPELAVAQGAAFIGLVGAGRLSFSDVPQCVPSGARFEPAAQTTELHEAGFDRLQRLYYRNRAAFSA